MLIKYYPSNVLVTGFDIIFFWVARMMMMGIYFMNGKSPFSEVYIHALVRDEKGQKMSKSKGNVLDPLDLIKEYGADPLRFTLSAMAAQGRDIKLSKERIAGYRNFSTKIINACKYLEINNCYNECDFDYKSVEMPVNKWIINLSNILNEKIKKSVQEYRFNDYSDLVYHFVWRDFCDWYIEFMKPIFNSGKEFEIIETRFVAKSIMENILKFLHPIMPFITEECHEFFYKSKKLLITSAWPKEIEIKNTNNSIPLIVKLISEIRAFRVERKITFKNKINLYINSSDKEKLKSISENIDLIKHIGKIENLKIDLSKNELSENLVVYPVENILLGFEDLKNIKEEEKIRLENEKNKIDNEVLKIEKMLNNKSFIANAPKEVILKTEGKKKELNEKIKEITKVLNVK